MNIRTLGMRLEEITQFLTLQQQCGTVEGWLHPLEGYFLHLLAAEGPGVGEIVEVGSYLGRSTAFLASGSRSAHREKITAVDHFRGSPEHQSGQILESKLLKEEGTTLHRFRDNLHRLGLAEQVTALVASSEEAARVWTKPIRLLFIDGDHSYEASRRDFEVWSPFVISGGIVCFHDIGVWPGVTRFYQELLQSPGPYKERFAVQTIRAIQRQTAE
jgi:predicted O-methyltransferase YrrM